MILFTSNNYTRQKSIVGSLNTSKNVVSDDENFQRTTNLGFSINESKDKM